MKRIIFILLIVTSTLLSGTSLVTSYSFVAKCQNDEELTVLIYPNPVSGVLYISISDKAVKPSTVMVYNIVGKKVLHNNIQRLSFDNKYQTDISHLPAGRYFLKIILNNNIQKTKHFYIR